MLGTGTEIYFQGGNKLMVVSKFIKDWYELY